MQIPRERTNQRIPSGTPPRGAGTPAGRPRKSCPAQKKLPPPRGGGSHREFVSSEAREHLLADGLRQRQTRRPAVSGAASWYSRYASLNHLLWLRGIPAVAVPARTPPPGGFLPSRHWGTVGRRRLNRCLTGPASPAKKSLGRSISEGQIFSSIPFFLAEYRDSPPHSDRGDEKVRPR